MPITQILLTASASQGGGGGGGGGGESYPLPGSGSYINSINTAGGVLGFPDRYAGAVLSVDNNEGGWAYYIKNGRFNSDVGFFNGVARTGVDPYGGFGSQNLPTEDYAIQWVGYIQVPTTGDYNIYLTSDDLLYFWIGSNALAGNFNFSNFHYSTNNSSNYANNSVTLVGGVYYPIRMWFQEWSGAEYAQVLIGPVLQNAVSMAQWTIVNNSQTNGHGATSTLNGIVHPFNGGDLGVVICQASNPNFDAFTVIPEGASITSNIPNFGTRLVTSSVTSPFGWIVGYDATGLTGTTTSSDTFNFTWSQ
jgi:hypothetical protein